jgi:hypothetical protein
MLTSSEKPNLTKACGRLTNIEYQSRHVNQCFVYFGRLQEIKGYEVNIEVIYPLAFAKD